MRLGGESGDHLELDLLGYQFENATNAWDANWLRVRVQAEVGGRRWEVIDPCLLADEVGRLADWLECLADGVEVAELNFVEPNLSLVAAERRGDLILLRAWFELELRPRWVATGFVGGRDFGADLRVTREQLTCAACDLRKQLAKFPPRPPVG